MPEHEQLDEYEESRRAHDAEADEGPAGEMTSGEPAAQEPVDAEPVDEDPAGGERGARPGATVRGPRPTAMERLRAAFLKPSRGQVVAALLLAGLGFAAVTQVRANDLDDTYASYRQQDLLDLLTSLSQASQRAQREIARLEATREELQSTTTRRRAALSAAEQAADNLDVLAGTVPVQGPGVRITVTPGVEDVDVDHVLDTVQELRTADAEAMEFNDTVRAVASTHFAEGPDGLEVDGQPLEPPYVIEAIGEPTTLHEALVFPNGPVDQFEEGDLATVEITELRRVVISSVVPSSTPEYAEPGTGQ